MLNFAYVLEVGTEDRSNTPIFQKIMELDLKDNEVFFDMEGDPQTQLDCLLTQIGPNDNLFIRSLLDLSDTAYGMIDILSVLTHKGVALHSCVEPYLPEHGYLEVVQGIMQIIKDYNQKKQKAAYGKAVEKGKVGRPAKLGAEDKEKVVHLYQEEKASIKDIQAITGLSKSTIKRYLRRSK